MVLLILAGVTISLVFSGDGIIAKAKEAAEKTNKAVADEQNLLNNIDSIIDDYINNKEDDPKIVLSSKKEDSFAVQMKGTNLKNYQFSLDGNNWTEPQQENFYNFTEVEKTIVTKENYETTKGKEYTVYAKAVNNEGKECIDTIKVKLPVEVQVDENEYYFTYEDLGEEIIITGRKDLGEFITDNGCNIDYYEDTIMIPSYINGKPVTQVSAELLKARIRSEEEEKMENLKIYINNTTTNEKRIKVIENVESGKIQLTIENLTDGFYQFVATMKDFIGFAGANAINGIFTVTPSITLRQLDNIVLPPTVNKIVDNKKAEQQFLNNKRLIPEDEEDRAIGSLESDLYIRLDDNEISTIFLKVLGKESKEEIENINLVDQINGEYQAVDYEFIN